MDLSTQVQEHKDLMSVNRTEKEYKALIEQLNDTISTLENKILNHINFRKQDIKNGRFFLN